MVAKMVRDSDGANGFSARPSASDARRQLRMSFGVVVVLSVAIVSAATTFGAHPISAKRDIVSMTPVMTMHADTAVVGATAI